jgi:hypothetical protein
MEDVKMLEEYGISNSAYELINECEKELVDVFKRIDSICEVNSLKVLNAFKKHRLSEIHLSTTTGYGYDDLGRDTCEAIFAEVLGFEDALVRNQFISGSHAITIALQGILRPNDTLLAISGTPYDTLHEVIGIKENSSSLMSYNVNYKQIDLVNNDFDYEKIKETVKENIKFVVVENKLKAIPTKEQLDEYTNKIEAEKSIFSIKKTDNKNAWIKINPNNSKKIILAPKLSLNGFSVDGWNEKTYEDYLEALKQIKDQINEKDSYILEKYIKMLENICGIFEKIENDLENPGIIPNKDNVEKLRKIRLDDLYTKIWYSGIKNKINGKISLDGKIKSTTGFTRGTGLLDWKYTPAGCNFIVGLQIQHLNFRITLEPEKGYKYNLNDNEKEVFFGNIQKWEEDILKKLENDVNINSYFVKWNYDLHKYGDFKYIQAEINENIKLEDITKVVNITLRYINDSISNLIIDERKIVKSN